MFVEIKYETIMNKKDIKKLSEFPKELDRLVKNEFGQETECESYLDYLGSMIYSTTFKAEGAKRKEIEAFIKGFLAENMELKERLTQ